MLENAKELKKQSHKQIVKYFLGIVSFWIFIHVKQDKANLVTVWKLVWMSTFLEEHLLVKNFVYKYQHLVVELIIINVFFSLTETFVQAKFESQNWFCTIFNVSKLTVFIFDESNSFKA